MRLPALAWNNLAHRPLGAILSVILLALGTGLIVLLLLLNRQLEEQFERNLQGIDLVVGAKGSPLQLLLSSVYHVDAPTGNISVEEALPYLNPAHPVIGRAVPLALGDSYRGFRVVGSTSGFADIYGLEIDKGSWWDHSGEAIVGATAARRLELREGSEILSAHGLSSDTNLTHEDHPMRVVGILKPSGTVADQLILTNISTVWETHSHGDLPKGDSAVAVGYSEEDHSHDDGHNHDHHSHEHATGKSAPPDPGLELQFVAEHPDEEITSLLLTFRAKNFQSLSLPRTINEYTDMMAANPVLEVSRLRSLLGTGTDALRYLALVIIVVSGLSVFIALYGSLRERRAELALMRTMGAGPWKLFSVLMLEGLLLALTGGILGLFVGHVAMMILSVSLEGGYGYAFTGIRFLSSEAVVLAGALVLGLIAAFVPAMQARRTDIAEALMG